MINISMSLLEKASKVVFKDKNLDLYKDNYISFKTTYPISSGEGIAVFLTSTDMFDNVPYKTRYTPFLSGDGLGLLPNIKLATDSGIPIYTFPDIQTSTADIVGLSTFPRSEIFNVLWGDGEVETPTMHAGGNYLGLNHHYYTNRGLSAAAPFFNHIASVAIDGRGGYGLNTFEFCSGGNDYRTPFSITNRVLTDALSSNQRSISTKYSVATHMNTTATLPVLSTGYKTLGDNLLEYSDRALTYRIKFSAFLLNMSVDILSGYDYINIANLSGINPNEKNNENFLTKFPRYARVGVAFSCNRDATDYKTLSTAQGVQNLTYTLG